MREISALNKISNSLYGDLESRRQQSLIGQRKTEGLRKDRVSLSSEAVTKGDRSEKPADSRKENQSVVFRRMEEAAKKEATGDYASLSPGQLFATIA